MPNINDLAPEPSDCGTVVIRGPKGDKGDQGEPGSPNIEVIDPITLDGTGTASDPYVIGLGLSADAGNNIGVGSDGGLYSPRPDGSETLVTAGTNIQVTGTGRADDPYVLSASGVVTSVTAADGTVTVTPTSGDVTIAAHLSTDADNTIVAGSDGGLYVPAVAPIGDTTYLLGETMVQTGSGTVEDPYVLDVQASADPGNALSIGTDGGLYVADVAAGVSSVTAADNTVTVTPTSGDVTVAAAVSPTAGNTLTADAGGLYVPDPNAAGTIWGVGFTDGGVADFTVDTVTGFQAVPVDFVDGNGVSAGASATEPLVIETAGYYLVTVTCRYGGVSTAGPFSIAATGGNVYGNTYYPGSGSGAHTITQAAYFNAGDPVTFRADGYGVPFRITDRQITVVWLGPGTAA
jgi:hypothetical protein